MYCRDDKYTQHHTGPHPTSNIVPIPVKIVILEWLQNKLSVGPPFVVQESAITCYSWCKVKLAFIGRSGSNRSAFYYLWQLVPGCQLPLLCSCAYTTEVWLM